MLDVREDIMWCIITSNIFLFKEKSYPLALRFNPYSKSIENSYDKLKRKKRQP